jgi:hypothetical protein
VALGWRIGAMAGGGNGCVATARLAAAAAYGAYTMVHIPVYYYYWLLEPSISYEGL